MSSWPLDLARGQHLNRPARPSTCDLGHGCFAVLRFPWVVALPAAFYLGASGTRVVGRVTSSSRPWIFRLILADGVVHWADGFEGETPTVSDLPENRRHGRSRRHDLRHGEWAR